MTVYKIIIIALFSLLSTICPKCLAQKSLPLVSAEEQENSVFLSSDFKEFRSLTVNEGFTRNSVFEIFQDEAGFLWFGSWDGVYRYDGSQLKHIYNSYTVDAKFRHYIAVIIEDDNHRIWMGTSKGIVIWDADKEQLIPFADIVVDGGTIEKGVKSICKDQEGNVWILTGAGIYVFSQQSQKLTDVTYLFKDNIKAANLIYIDRQHKIWLATNNFGIYKIESAGESAGQEQRWKLVEDELFGGFKTANVSSFFQDSQSNYWLGINRGIRLVRADNKSSLKIGAQGNSLFLPEDIHALRVTSFAEGDGYLYATTNQGLFVYSLNHSQHTWIQPDYSERGCLTDKSLKKVLVDREGGIWIGSFYGGVNYLAPTAGNFTQYIDVNKHLSGHVVSGVAEDGNGNIWMAVEDGGVALWNRTDKTVTNFTRRSQTVYNPSRTNVQSIFADDKYVYVGTFGGGLDIIDVKTMKSKNYRSTNTFPDALSNSVYAFYRASQHFLFVGGIDGLYYLDFMENECHRIPNVRGKVNCIIQAHNGDYWVSTIYHGVFLFERKSQRWRHLVHEPGDSTTIACNDINTMMAGDNSVYLGTQGKGLWEYSYADNEFHPIAAEVLGKSLIFKILGEGDSLWITTNRGLYSYNRVTRTIQQFTSKDGLCSDLFKENSGIITSDGLYIVGGVNGINCFRPSNLRYSLKKPQVILTELYLLNKPVNMKSEDSPLEKSFSYSDRLEINQKDNDIAFRFSSSSHNDPNKNKYEYMLEPFDKEWQRTVQLNNNATYTNLPAGEYVFKVRTSNGISDWSDVRQLALTVHPYWWASFPMQVFYMLFLLAIVLFLVRRSKKQKKEEMRMFRFEKEQEVYRSKMEFFTCVVHEIRTPLTLILGPLSNIMRKTGRIEEVKSELNIIQRNGNRLMSLVNQLMDFRKVEEQSYTVQMSHVDLGDLVKQITSEFKLYNVNKPINIQLTFPDTPCWGNVDRDAFMKILSNLLSNAMKFTEDRIEVGIEAVKGDKYWNVYVRDNGCGIAQDDQESIFDTFYQVNQNRPSDYIGSGIGLFVVRRLLELQGGSISLESEVGKGSCFKAQVQRVAPPDIVLAPQEVLPSDLQEQDDQDSCSECKHLLVVEDNEEMRNYIASVLAEKYNVDTCPNGKSALEYISKHVYDLIITDLMMPEMDGMTLCKRLKSNSLTCHIPVIILTAKDDENSQKEGFESMADLYVTKPFSSDVLNSQIKALINIRERLRKQFYSEPESTTEVLCTSNSDKIFLENLDDLILQNLEDCNISVDSIAKNMALGRSVFYQKVKGITGLTPNEYIRTFRLKKAAAMFHNGESRISEVCYRVGFSSPSYFAKRFTLQFGISPSDYLKKLHR